jgi:hypothetical protein
MTSSVAGLIVWNDIAASFVLFNGAGSEYSDCVSRLPLHQGIEMQRPYPFGYVAFMTAAAIIEQ